MWTNERVLISQKLWGFSFKNPVGSFSANAYMLNDDIHYPKSMLKLVKTIVKNGNRLGFQLDGENLILIPISISSHPARYSIILLLDFLMLHRIVLHFHISNYIILLEPTPFIATLISSLLFSSSPPPPICIYVPSDGATRDMWGE